MKTSWIVIVWLGLCLETSAHGRSGDMIRELNAPVPEWMSLAEPIKADPIETQSLPSSLSFRPRSGGATNSRNRVQIPQRGIEFQVDYPIDYTGNNAAGRGVSLSPDGTRLIVNSGTKSYLYEIAPNGGRTEVPIDLPHVTYDDGTKGFITKWSWAGDNVLVGRAGITDEAGHEIIESRLYVFYMKERALARLDLSLLDLRDNAGIEVVSIGDDLGHLRIRSGGRDFAFKADLKSPPRLVAKADSGPAPEKESIAQPSEAAISPKAIPSPTRQGKKPVSSTWWPVLPVVIIAAIGLFWLWLRKRR